MVGEGLEKEVEIAHLQSRKLLELCSEQGVNSVGAGVSCWLK